MIYRDPLFLLHTMLGLIVACCLVIPLAAFGLKPGWFGFERTGSRNAWSGWGRALVRLAAGMYGPVRDAVGVPPLKAQPWRGGARTYLPLEKNEGFAGAARP